MKRIFSFADGSQTGRQWNGEFIASLVKKMLILLGIMLLPNMSNAAIRRFEVTKTSYVYIDNGAKADPGSLPAAVDSVNKYSTDSCAIIFKLKANDTIKVTSYVAKEISNETYTLIDGGKNGAKIKPASGNYFIISGANHVVLKNMEFLNDGGYNALKIESSVVDTITNCKFIDNSSSYGALYLVSSTVTSINNCLFSGNNIGLSTDASASVTVSDCQFLDNNRMGISGNANPNLILRNCTISGNSEGLRNFYGKAYNCVFKNNESASYTGSGNFYNCIFSQNSTAAIQGSANVINKCRFTENGTAINAVQGTAIDSVCYSYIGNNKIGINISQTQITNIIGDTIVSNQAQGIYIGTYCTHIYNNFISDNNVGIEIVRTSIDSICGNTIVSNKTSGVISTHRSTLKAFNNNYIGTNSKFEALGNGEDGIFFTSSSTTIPSEFKNNVIGNNGRYGIDLEASTPQFTIESCYLGVAPDSTPIPNAKGGLYIGSQNHKTVLKNSSFSMNGGTGVKATVQGELSLSGCSFYANQGYGVYFASEFTPYKFSVDNCVFDQNDSSAIYTSYPNAGEGSSYVTSSVSNTLFLNTKKKLAANKAIETNNPLPAPVITSVKEDENGYLVISGKVESEGKSFVELYLCENGEETTSKFMASDSTDADGNFAIQVQRTTFSVIIVATASSSGETSAFSSPYTHFNGNRGNYYVKENGRGDGSNWKAAMSGKDFVKLLPLASAGVTFHVAAGTYDLKDLSGGYSYVDINNPVTIIGGYPADAQTGASSVPLANTTLMKTGYFRLKTGGNVVFDGLKFDNQNYRGAYDANSYGKYGLCVTLKNSVVEGNESNGNAVYSAHGGKTILYNDIIMGSYTYSAVFSRGDSLIINRCRISGAKAEGGVGAEGGYLNIDSTSITENAVYGIYLSRSGSAIVTNSVITKNGGDGIYAGAGPITLKNNRIGVDGKGNVAGNRIGVVIAANATSSIIEDNIIAGNDSIGISLQTATNQFRRNYIGTDKDFNDLGNGSDGLFIGGRCSVIFPSSLDSANFIGFNKGYGIYSQGNMTACNASFNYIGVTPQGDPMPNGKYGVYLETSRSSQTLKGNVIGFNGAGGVYYSDNYTTITENLFFGTKGKAISDRRTTYKPACPAITKITRDEDVIRVEGTTDTSWVSTIELFYTNGDPQTAHEFLGRTETDNTGAFSFAIPGERLSKYGKEICLSATATYSTYSQGVSELSDPFCCKDCMCKLDTTLANDTIYVGEKFMDKTYTEIGRYKNIYEELLKDINGCDSVVAHSLVVLYPPSECENGTILFREDFGGNFVSEPVVGPALPNSSSITLTNSTGGMPGYNGYLITKEAVKRQGPEGPIAHVYKAWYADFGDHTHEGDMSRGYFMQVDLDKSAQTFYKVQVDDLCENTQLYFTIYGHPVNYEVDAPINLTIEDLDGNVLNEEIFVIYCGRNEWQRFDIPFVVQPGQSSVVYKVYSSAGSNGGDFALDDIEVRLCKPSVLVNAPSDSLCEGKDYELNASYTNRGGYVEPLNFTWFKNENFSYDLDGWSKVAEGQTLALNDMELDDNAYYRCVISSAGVPGEFNKCNSASEIIPILVKSCICTQDTTIHPTIDTIQIGEEYLGITYTSVGRYENIFETLQDVDGCDSVVMHRLIVKPDSTVKNYYVKMDRWGTGDGSNWENAMDSVDFATYLPLAPDGATFYVAEGTYTPIYNESLVRPISPAVRCYAIKSSVTIRGGYPDTAEGDAVSEPDKYKTIFNGDILGEDVIDETLDENGYPLLTRTSALDNTYSLFHIVQPDQQTITFDGVVMRNAERAVDIGNSNKTVNVLNCTFYYNDNVASSGYGNISVSVYHSFVEKNKAGFNLPAVKDVVLDDVVFKNNLRNLLYTSYSAVNPEPGSVTINNVRAIENGDGFTMMGYNTTVTNSEFESNLTSNTNLLNIMDCQNGLSVKIEDCRFLQNKGTLIYSHHSDLSIENCSFEKNEVGEKKMFCIETPSEYIQAGSGRYVINGSVFKENDASTLIDCHGEETTLNFVNSSMEDNKASVSVISSNVDSLIIDHVKFNHNSLTPGKDFLSAYIASGYVGIKNSEFSNNISALDPQDIEETNGSDLIYMRGAGDGNTSYVEGNAFGGNQVGYIVTTYMAFDTAVISNNTIVSNELYSSVLNYSHVTDAHQLSLNNNTIIGNAVEDGTAVYLANADVNFTGNIIVGNVDTTGATTEYIGSNWSAPEFNYNILPYFLDRGSLSVCAEEIPLDKNILTFTNPEKSQCVGLRDTKDRNEEILTTLFEGTYDKRTNLFTPVLKDNGGPTPTVALKTDLLTDGTSIRFPLKETVVSTDQRGETRLDPTCMGAYEIACSDIETTVQDTVVLGDPYTFNGEDLSSLTSQVGIHTLSDTIRLASGCDSIINLQLAVRPQKKDGGYYVKVDGTGDGSDWENAMSPKDFATYLPLVYDGDTFHVAAGTYRCEVEDPVYGHTFCVNKDVTIIGGYPDTVTIVGTPSSPDVYTTLLTANNDDEEYMYMYMNSSFPSIGSFAKNEPSLVRVVGQPHVTLFGLTLSGVKNTNDGAVSLLDGAALDMDRCVVTKNQASAIYAKNADVKVTNSEFSLNFTGVGSVFNLSDSKLEVSTSTIYENFSNDTFCVNGGSKGAVAYLNSSSAVFVNNTIVKNRASAGAVFAADGSTLDLTNNTITGNMIEPGAGTAGSVFNFIGGSSNMKLFGNMIVANDKTSMTGTATITSSDYNIFSPDITIEKGANDMTMSNTQVPYVMDVENAYGEEDLYIPILRDNGGITPTVALSQSLFDGGAVLSIPRDVRAVDFDQRGFVRKDTSCVGAFEFPTYVDYYVKTRSHGDGSGRDWDNAMGDTSFARYFAIAPTGATFHVAAGLYHPMFDCSGKLVSGSGVLYKASRPINVIGSYPANAKEGDTPDALKYKTILSADLMEDDIFSPSQETYTVWSYDGFRNNAIAVMSITLKQAGACHLYGLTFKGNFPLFRGSSSALLIGRAYETVAPTSFVLDSCVFTKTYAGVYSTADSVVMRSCRFDTISSVGFSHSTYSMDESYFFADGCSFTSSNNGLSYLAQKGLLRVQNTTFSNVLYNALDVSPSLWKQDLTLQLYNNTFSHRKGNVNSIYLPNYVNTELKGNIFNTGFTFHSSSDAAATVVASDYNLYAYSPDTTGSVCPKGEHDLMVEPKDLVGIMDGSLSDDAFISTGKTLSDNDMVSVVKILEDKLPDGSFIRLPLEEAFVSVDAIGKERNKQTCMGAYEMDCRPDTFVVGDTIQIGQSFQGVTYDTVGNYKIYGPDSVNVIGCPLTIEHHLYVTPSFEGSGFYVKTERTGKGTGADWDNAMNGADFLYGLPLVEAGATFHVAQGSYNMNELAGAASVTAVNPVSVIGGYKNTAKMGDGKNAAFETNFVSDSSFILNIISPAAAGEVPAGIYDLRMSGVQLNVKGNMNVEVDSCTFEKFDVAVTMDSTAALALKATSFDGGGKNATAVYTESLKSVSVENCSFTGISAGEDGKGYALRCGNTSGDVTIKNTTFAGNQTASLIEIGHLDGKTYLYNNTIAGNGGTECTLSLGDAVMKGNIFSGNVASKLSTTSLENAYNVFSSTDEFASDLDVKLPVEQLPLYLDGTYDANTGIFDAHLNANGGFVKTVAILKDSFPDHSVARFPIENTTVDHDARGVVRLDLLCYGAYELYDGVRDTITLPILDTVCLGMNYEKRGWNIETSQLEAGTSYLDTVFVKGVISTDTIYTLELRVMTFEKLRLDSVAVSPTRCPGSGSGMVYLGTSCNRTGSMSVTIMDADTETKDTVLSQSYPFNYADVVYDDLGVGKYTLRVTPISQCAVLDTTIALEVKDRGDLQALPCEDTIMVRCANNPENYLAVALTGFHPSMKVYFDDELITDEDANPHAYVYYEDDAAFSAKGEVRLSAIAPGVHTVTATDEECDKKYELKEFVVAVEESYAIEMQLVDYRRDSLKCGLDYGFAKFNLKSGVNTVFSLKSDKGYQKQLTFTEQMDSTFTFSDLSAGNYQALFKKNDPNCSDSVSASFSIFSPEPLTLSLTSNGAACAEGAVTVTAAGGAGKYIYHWTNPMGEKFDSVSTKLNDVSAGDYICVVEDSTGCLSRPDTLSIVPNVEDLSELTKDTTIIKNITCFKGENGTIEVHFSTDNHKQSVACVVTNDEDGSQTKTAGAYADNKGKLIINTLGVGSYTYEVYYGTESCRLDTNSIKGAFSIAAKEVPFSMTPLVDELKQTCFDPADGRTSNVATGWEDDYTAWMIVDDGDVHDDNKIKPITNGSETKLIAPYGLGNGHSYYYLVKDACGSEMTTNSVNFPAYEPLTLTVDTFVDSVVCARSSDAMIRFTVSGGIGDNHKAFVNDKVFTEKGTILCDNIGKGDYYVSYRYKSNLVKETCKDSVGVYVRIAGPDTLAIQYTLTGNCATSKIIPEVTGESGAYTYLWSNGDTTIAGEVNSPFETMEEGKTYSLTVSDVKGCDQYTKTITMPSASDLPSLTHSVYGESQKCHGVDNGLIVIKPTLSKKMDYAITATSYYHLIDVEDSTSHEFVLNPDDSYVTPQTLAPGKYRVTTRLGSMDCDMGVDPVSSVVTVDSLQPLKIQSDFENKPMTCLIPNGESKFTVDGWTYTHTANLYIESNNNLTMYKGMIKPGTYMPNYVGNFDVDSLSGGHYTLIVMDKCSNSDTADFTIDQYIPKVKLDASSMENSICINQPTGKLNFEIYGWTKDHTVNFNRGGRNYAGENLKNADTVVVDTVNGQPRATVSMSKLPSGSWRAIVTNECHDELLSDTLLLGGIDPYKVELVKNDSKLHLDCPYHSDGKIALKVSGGFTDADFTGFATRSVTYYGPTGKTVDSLVLVPDTSYYYVPVYDSTDMIVQYDTTFKFISRDTVSFLTDTIRNGALVLNINLNDPNISRIDTLLVSDTVISQITVPEVTFDTTIHSDSLVIATLLADSIVFNYDMVIVPDTIIPQKVNSEGELVFDTIMRLDSVLVGKKMPVYGYMDSLETTQIDPDKYPTGGKVGDYLYVDLPAGTYRFTYKSALEGCTDKYNFDTEVTKPAPVRLEREVMPISCSSSEDGVISLAPRRGGKDYPYIVGHDSTESAYNINRLYVKDVVDGKDTIVEYKPGGVTLTYRIDTLYDRSDLKDITWSYKSYKKDASWAALNNIVFPDSADFMEEVYYSKGDTIRTPVYSNTHLESFWADYMGEFSAANVVTISNLAPGFYAVLVTDSSKCQYRDTFEVKLPEKPLKIDSVLFDSNLAECDPTKRQILAYVSGGWGEYNFTFSDTAKVKSLGEQSDGFRGGEATHYDKNTLSGWGVSQFLDPGLYTVVVLDEQGCMVKSENQYSVKSKFKLHIDSTRTKCPEDPTAEVMVKFVTKPDKADLSYTIVEYVSPCRNDTLDDCRDYRLDTLTKTPVKPVNDEIAIELSSLKMRSKTHGLFVYANDDGHCGSYVQGTVVDTVPIFKSSMKSVQHVSCNGDKNGKIELYVSGGDEPYAVQRNSSWHGTDEVALFENLSLVDTSFKMVLRDPTDSTYAKDTIIKNYYLTLNNLEAGDYYLTVIDARGCRSVMGDTSTYNEKLVVKQPDTLKAMFDASVVCPEASVTKGGNVFFQNVKGGTAPYTFSLNHMREGKADSLVIDCDPISMIYGGDLKSTILMEVSDKNGCRVNEAIRFRNDSLQVDSYDFWATSWYDFGDVVALIDICGPEQTFDSVSYVFYDKNNKVDPKIKILDKRMYIYDLESDKVHRDFLYQSLNTKAEVPDSYFEKWFKLRDGISKGQARHLNFFKYEDASIDLKNKDNLSKALAEHSVLMKAYFLGCEYQYHRNDQPLRLINPNNPPELDSIGQKYQIISLEASPNPFEKESTISVKATFSGRPKSAVLYIYHIDGKTNKQISIDVNTELKANSNGEFVYTHSEKATELFGEDMPGYTIIYLRTDRDQKSTTLLHAGN